MCKGKELGKRKFDEVDPKPRTSGYRCLTSSFAQVDSFGDVKALSLDKFGALRDPEEERPNVNRRVEPPPHSSVGSFTPLEHIRIEGGKAHQYQGTGDAAATTQAVNDSTVSTWGQYIDVDWENEGTSQAGNIEADPSSHSSVPFSCTLHERTSTSGGPTLQQFGKLPHQKVSGYIASKLTV